MSVRSFIRSGHGNHWPKLFTTIGMTTREPAWNEWEFEKKEEYGRRTRKDNEETDEACRKNVARITPVEDLDQRTQENPP